MTATADVFAVDNLVPRARTGARIFLLNYYNPVTRHHNRVTPLGPFSYKLIKSLFLIYNSLHRQQLILYVHNYVIIIICEETLEKDFRRPL